VGAQNEEGIFGVSIKPRVIIGNRPSKKNFGGKKTIGAPKPSLKRFPHPQNEKSL